MAPPQPTVPALLNRMTTPNQPIQPQPVAHGAPPPKQFRAQNTHPQRTTQMLPTLTIIPTAVVPVPPRRVRQKKGPKRIKKLQRPAATIDQLDKEIDDYRAAADV
ncbi:hypothetical protein DXG03_003638 [Asterophora parasitica]|uniref:Chromatin target of PRMT1 protein C-terminal domain-containing protein n=1 Tax=Asterophora parasitica TaxID=117018 RepID=A0A9P7G7C6_9AGAR|nr:hypothetical protein DXG03_003638 [Asterophora parasitica]